jgi:hypothetical protein
MRVSATMRIASDRNHRALALAGCRGRRGNGLMKTRDALVGETGGDEAAFSAALIRGSL